MPKLAGFGAACLVLAAILPASLLAQNSIDLSNRKNITVRNAVYSISENPSKEFLKCLYRNQVKLLCPPGAEFISFEKIAKTKDYDIVVLSTGGLGSGTRSWDWSLLIENGDKGTVKSLAKGCLGCAIRVEKLKYSSNTVSFVFRQARHRVSARFRDGVLSIQRVKLDPSEPLARETCNALYENYFHGELEACIEHRRNSDPASSLGCAIAGKSNAGHFFLLQVENDYAGISRESLEQECKKDCSSGTPKVRATFLRKICRLPPS